MKEKDPKGVSLFVPLQESLIAYAHQTMMNLTGKSECYWSKTPLGNNENMTLVCEQMLKAKDMFALHLLATPTCNVPQEELDSIAQCGNAEANWLPCKIQDNAEPVKLEDLHVCLLQLIVFCLSSDKSLLGSLRSCRCAVAGKSRCVIR